MLRPPRQQSKRIGLRMEKEIRVGFIAETGYSRGVKGDSVFKGSGKLFRHDGYVLLPAEYVAESDADEFYVLFLYVLYYLFFGILHKILPAFFLFELHLKFYFKK